MHRSTLEIVRQTEHNIVCVYEAFCARDVHTKIEPIQMWIGLSGNNKLVRYTKHKNSDLFGRELVKRATKQV